MSLRASDLRLNHLRAPLSPSSRPDLSASSKARKLSTLSKDDASVQVGLKPTAKLRRPCSTPSMFPYRHHRSLPDLTDLRGDSDDHVHSPVDSCSSKETTPLGGSSETLKFNVQSGTGKELKDSKNDNKLSVIGDIADGALSDSEIDHHSHHKRVSRQGEAEWKWGEFPESSKDKDKKQKQRQLDGDGTKNGSNKAGYGWGWFSWSRRGGPSAIAEEGSTNTNGEHGFDPTNIANGVPPIVRPIYQTALLPRQTTHH